MKKLYYLSIILTFFLWLPKTQAQEYHPMLGDTVVWYETDIFEGITTNIYTTMGDDTMVNNLLYRKIVQTEPYSTDYTFPYILLREDTETKKIYAKPYHTEYVDSEVVIYDYNLLPGDSFFVYDVNNTISPIAWYHVDSVGLFNTLIDTRKVFYLSSNINGYESKPVWVEGIGSLAGLTLNSIEVSYNFINCYIRNDSLIYESDYAIYYNNCDISVSINEADIYTDVKIEPNPIHSNLIVKKSNSNYIYIEIYDIFGRLLNKYYTNNIYFEIDVNNLISGIYIIKIRDKNNLNFTKKIIKN